VAPFGTIRELEGRGLNALPALETEDYDGWLLRASKGYTGRANSASPLHHSDVPVADKISYTEAWYRRRRLPPMIRLTAAARPPGLDAGLAERGYMLRDEAVSLQTRSLDAGRFHAGGVDVSEGRVPAPWLAVLAGFQSRVAEHIDTVREVFVRLPRTSAWGMVNRNGSPVAIGRAVLEGTDLGLFDVITRPDLRRTGLATDITVALLGWGVDRGARRAYLQVVPGNEAAVRLYAKLGFEEMYQYWYRIKKGLELDV